MERTTEKTSDMEKEMKKKKSRKESKLERKVKKMGTRKCFPLRKGKGRMKNNEKEI